MFFYDIKVNVMNVYYFLKSNVKKDEKSASRLLSIEENHDCCLLDVHYHSLTAANYIWINKVLNINRLKNDYQIE